MVIHHPKTALEAVELRKSIENSLYLAGGTEDLRLNGPGENKELINITSLVPSTIEMREDKLIIGGMATFQDLIDSPLVPKIVKEGARLCASFEKRNSATVGGNIASRRDDSYLLALFSALDVTFHAVTPHGEEERRVDEYGRSKCKCLIMYFTLDPNRTGYLKRFGNTSSSHATLIAAESNGKYALSVKGFPLTVGTSPDIYKDIDFVSDITGSKEYKKYLASIVFDRRRK